VLADAMPSRWAFEGLLLPEADARATLELPAATQPTDPDDTSEPGRTRVEDLAEAWFPRAGWRSGADTPEWMLFAMWGLGVVALKRLLERDELGRSR
jgi:hypothetical protein